MMRRRAFLAGAVAAAALPKPAIAQGAAGFPSRPITLICPWPAGGPTDVVMRGMADAAGKVLGQPVVVDNKAGASGTLGAATMVATAKPDGYTIAQMPIGMVRIPMMQKATWDIARDFTYIVHLTGYIFGITTHAKTPFKTWADVVAYAKENPAKVTYATPGAATSLHIGMEQIAAQEGIKLTQVPFKGQAEALASLLGGHTDLMAAGTSMDALIQKGDVRPLAVWSEQRLKRLPDVPTLKELGMPFVFDSPWGFAGPKGMAPEIVATLHDAFKKALEDPVVQEMMERQEMAPRYMNSSDYARFMDQLVVQERAFLDRIGLLKKD